MTSRDIRQIYQDRYAGEKLVKIVGEPPLVKAIQNKHGVEIGGFAVDSTGKRVVVCATIDNLLKGAATQLLRKSFRRTMANNVMSVVANNVTRKHEPGPRIRRIPGNPSRMIRPTFKRQSHLRGVR